MDMLNVVWYSFWLCWSREMTATYDSRGALLD